MNENNNNKTILYLITQSEYGGAQKYILDLILNLKGEFNIFVAFGSPRKQEEDSEFIQKLKENNIEFFALKRVKREISPLNDFLAIFEIRKLIKKLKPDIIHLNSSKISIIGSIAAKKCSMFHVPCSVIYTVHGWVFNEPISGLKKAFYRFAEKFTAKYKSKIICINKFDYDCALYILKIKEKKLSLIYHGLKPVDFFSPEETRPALLSQYNIPESSILIGVIANLYKTKGLDYLIQAIKLLVESGIGITTIVMGEGDERKNLEDLISQLNLKNKFILAGTVKDAARTLKMLDIYVCPSVKEGLPYSIMEAMFAGLPIIATQVGGIPELIQDGKNGLLVESEDPELLAEKIKELLRNEELLNRIAKNAEQDANEKFSLDRMINETKGIYFGNQ